MDLLVYGSSSDNDEPSLPVPSLSKHTTASAKVAMSTLSKQPTATTPEFKHLSTRQINLPPLTVLTPPIDNSHFLDAKFALLNDPQTNYDFNADMHADRQLLNPQHLQKVVEFFGIDPYSSVVVDKSDKIESLMISLDAANVAARNLL